MDFKVIKGNPTDDEIAALSMVFAEIQAASAAKKTTTERNLWGASPLRAHPATLFNPGAFSNVTYF